ncbi:pyridoxamine 5'-phosphate oxidase [Iamia sp. SCSIO 61187]|uniref:pyridoxamine 5'-phosphate oxidase family protein n=1 Tax=Iamia sp. SCSIO 61187 TaxID=2722752 RepID=UPI001C62DC81|nr:pyridoxamine 5'-phosphate oxidase family protein [Iamia sp. SCSIO 61187]QYG91722.1 pyridoxamine 5'-phosphate oxidase [Iamia sp. SCSIO 61187]
MAPTLTADGRRRLAHERNLWLSTVRPDGRAHLAPVWFVFVADRLWVVTGRSSVRVANLRANPAAAASLEDADRPLVATGRVTVHDHVRPGPLVDAFAVKYGWDVTVEVDDDLGELVLLEMEVSTWHHPGRPAGPDAPGARVERRPWRGQ